MSVIGPNGSGKSTLFNAISGLVILAEGTIHVESNPVQKLSPNARVAMGVARTFQTPRFDPNEDVLEAAMCGYYPRVRSGWFSAMFGLPSAEREEQQLRQSCQKLLADLGLNGIRNKRLGEISMGQLRLVDVARAIANEPKYLLLDEPAAGLSRTEQSSLAYEVRQLAKQGVGVLLVEHNFSLVRELADHVLVLDRGHMRMSGAPREIEKDPTFVELYLGSSATRK